MFFFIQYQMMFLICLFKLNYSRGKWCGTAAFFQKLKESTTYIFHRSRQSTHSKIHKHTQIKTGP